MMSRSAFRPGCVIAPIARLVVCGFLALTLLLTGPLQRAATAVCGDGIVDAEEDCDLGGTCIGGPAAGRPCHVGDATCSGGACTTFGGTGCAANCTGEHDVPYVLGPCPPQIGPIIVPESGASNSCVTIASDFLVIPLPFDAVCSGGENANQACGSDADCPGGSCIRWQQTWTVGRERNGKIPVVVKAASVKFPGVPISTLACGCVKGVATKTCGGTVFEADGVSLSANCTPGFSAGDSVCAGKAPCAFVHGAGNAAAGEIGCEGLDGIDYCSGCCGIELPLSSSECPLKFTGHGGPGSAVVWQSLAITSALGACTGADPSTYGPDGVFCTDDDPVGGVVSVASTLPLVTGTATAVVYNANGSDGENLGPVTASGAPFSCAALECGDRSNTAGGSLAGAYALEHLDTVGDVAVAIQLPAGGTPVTSCPTPSATPSVCVGDCDGDGAVTVDEIIILVNIALGSADAPACPAGRCNVHSLDITCDILAVGNALNGCG